MHLNRYVSIVFLCLNCVTAVYMIIHRLPLSSDPLRDKAKNPGIQHLSYFSHKHSPGYA